MVVKTAAVDRWEEARPENCFHSWAGTVVVTEIQENIILGKLA